MEQGFADACIPLCMGERPTSRLAQSCSKAASEMPKPTVRKWCEHGYNVAFTKSLKDLRGQFQITQQSVPVQEEIVSEREREQERNHENERRENVETVIEQTPEADEEEEGENEEVAEKVLARIPITLDDVEYTLTIHEGTDVSQAVESFCEERVPVDVAGCVQELLPSVLQKMVLA